MVPLSRIRPWLWLLLTTTVAVVAFGGATVSATHRARIIDAMAEDIAVNADPSIRYLADTRTELHKMAMLIMAGFSDEEHATIRRDVLDAHWAHLHQDIDAYLALPFFATERERWNAVDQLLREAERQMDAVLDRLDVGDVRGAKALRDGPFAAAVEKADMALGTQIAFDADQGSRLGREIAAARLHAERALYLFDGIAAVLAVLLLGVAVNASRKHVHALERARDAEGTMTRKLEAVASTAVSIAENARRRNATDLLQVIVDSARSLVVADFAALGMGADASRPFDSFVYAGVEPSLMDRVGPPRPVGVLGVPIEHGRTLRVDDVTKDTHFRGLPEGHPPIGPFLGTTINHEDERMGNLYLARRPSGAPFTDQDVHAVELLATFAATALQNSRLYAALRREVTSREDLLSMVSHDLRNPLSAIGLGARMLQRGAPNAASGRRHVDLIARNADRMERMIADLLTAAKLQEGKLTVEPHAQLAASIVAETTESLAGAAADRGVALRVEIPDDLPPVYCDAGRIGQVLSNLIGNALKFTPGGGSVTVSARESHERGPEVLFSVRDTGVGIAEDALARVFERFWQGGEQASRGTGLGLFIAKGIVDSHRGRIWVKSRLGEGSDFQFTLPAASEGVREVSGEKPDDRSGEPANANH